MQQLEIKFFFPLTEQIPLDLDYSQCSPCYVRAQGIAGVHGPFPTGTCYIEAPKVGAVTIQTQQLTIKGQPMPWYRKVMFKILGFKYD